MSPLTVRLAHLGHQLLLRLPRLIAELRSFNSADAGANLFTKLHQTQQLLMPENVEAEDEVLHRVRRIKTSVPLDEVANPCSFEFESLAEHRAALSYCKTRLLPTNLCIKLPSLPATVVHHSTHPCPFGSPKTQADQHRITTNFVMSGQYVLSIGVYALQAMPSTFITCWQALSQMSKDAFHHGLSIDVGLSFVLRRSSDTYNARDD